MEMIEDKKNSVFVHSLNYIIITKRGKNVRIKLVDLKDNCMRQNVNAECK
jgi:hypothetical protein